MKSICVYVFLLAFIASVGSQETSRWYLLAKNRQYFGYIHVTREKSKKRQTLLFIYDIAAVEGDCEFKMHIEYLCQNNKYYTPIKIDFTNNPQNEKFSCKLDGDKFIKDSVMGMEELTITSRTVVVPLQWEIICALPFDKGQTFVYDALLPAACMLDKGRTIVYLGEENLQIGGKTTKLYKFREDVEENPIFYWLNEEHLLVKLLDGENSFVLGSERRAKKLYKKNIERLHNAQ